MADVTRDDIICYIEQNFQVKVTIQELIRPNETFVVNVCNLFLSGFGLQQTDQPSFEARINCPPGVVELPPEPQMKINVFNKVKSIVQKVGFDVVFGDFVLPTPKRLYALLIALCQSHTRFSTIKNKMDQFRRMREPIYNEKEKLKAELMEIKSQHESVCIALNTLNVEETETQKTENNNLKNELSKSKKRLEERNSQLKKLQDENRKIMEENSNYEIEIAQKKSTIRAESEKIIRSPMKTINAANDLRTKQQTLQADLRNLFDLENEQKKVLAKEKELERDILQRISNKIASFINSLEEARGQYMSSKQIEDEIQKTQVDLSSIVSQISERKKNLDSQKSANNEVIEKIKFDCESCNQLISDILKDLPNKNKEFEARSEETSLLQAKVKQIEKALAELPDKMKALKEQYVDYV